MLQYIDKYKDLRGKKDSLYLYVLYNCSHTEIKEHIKKQLEIISRVSDSYKRKLYSSKYYLLRDTTEEIADNCANIDNYMYNNIIFIGDSIECYELTKSQQSLLKDYEHRAITYVNDDFYDLDFLKDLIFNNNPYHIYKINNNKIDYLIMTKTKKVKKKSKESKQLNISEFINSTLPPNKKFILYGMSSKLKHFNDDRAYSIIHHSLKDEDVIELVDKIDQEEILINLDNDLAMMHDSKQVHKVVFKKDIHKKIKYGQLEKLYIDSKMHNKFIKNMEMLSLELSFQVVQVDQSIKSFIENREKKIMQYGGTVGITYY